MPQEKTQSFANHTMFDPAFHFFLGPIALANVFVQGWNLYRHFEAGSAWILVLAIAALVAVFKMRLYSLKVQDRVIRAEERLRLYRLLPEGSREKIERLTPAQLVGLRFAGDAELPGLVDKTLAGNLKTKEIKLAVTNWRADHFRV